MSGRFVECPVCNMKTTERVVNEHLDKGCPPKENGANGATGGSAISTPKVQTQRSLSFGKPPPSSAEKSPIVETKQVKRKNDASSTTQNQTEEQSQPEKKPKLKGRGLATKPLAELVRPRSLDDFIGQEDLVGPKGILRTFIERDSCPSMILWGPSGVGKTSLARIIAQTTKARFVEMSAAINTVSDIKKVFDEARNELKLLSRKTILFLDEIHRFNRAQQDAFLPHVEKGDITLIGATTENPSFKINGALISRSRVFVLKKLTQADITKMLQRALALINEESQDSYEISNETVEYLAGLADGDGRIALNIFEIALKSSPESKKIDLESVKGTLKRTHMLYDRVGDSHYDTISAFHKSIRGSDPDATLFYLGRMLESGEDPLYVARRMIRVASEDIGVLDDTCLPFATATYTATQQIGMPEADCILAHCAVKLAKAPKSVQVYRAYNAVKDLLKNEPGAAAAVVPIHLRNAPTRLMKEIGYGKEYKYNPGYADGRVKQEYMPEGLEHVKFLQPLHLGTEVDPDLDN